MHQCSFQLNSQPMSNFKLGIITVPVFSGLAANVNKLAAACFSGAGPIPPGGSKHDAYGKVVVK